MSLPEEKSAIRTALLRQRSQLSPAQQEHFGLQAQSRLLDHESFRLAQVVALYSPIRNEVPTGLILARALSAGKLVCYPRVIAQRLQFFRVEAAADMQVGCFGICEPDPHGEEISPARIELMLIPGIAFDRRGFRLGYGRGFFDRILGEDAFGGLRVGFGYEFQLVDRLPIEPHDQDLDLLVTDKQVFSPSKSF